MEQDNYPSGELRMLVEGHPSQEIQDLLDLEAKPRKFMAYVDCYYEDLLMPTTRRKLMRRGVIMSMKADDEDEPYDPRHKHYFLTKKGSEELSKWIQK